MRHSTSACVPILALALAGGGLAACTAIGYGVGALIDKGKDKKVKPVGGAQDVETLPPGTAVELQLHDGRVLRGRYQGLDWTRADDYPSRYEAARRSLAAEVTLPELGPGARIAVTNGTVAEGELLGFGPGFVLFDEHGGGEPTRVAFHRIASVADAGGRTISGSRLESLVAGNRIPLRAGLRLEQDGGTIVVPYGDVMTAGRLVSPRGAKTAGLVVGAVLDAIAVAAIIDFNNGWDSSSNTTTTSCPLIDSFDGEGWQLDAEPLGGAIYAAAQRRDSARLAHLAAVDGEYRLRLRNEQAEIDYLDAVGLRVIDHAPGVEVVPDSEGRVHLVRDPVPPSVGRDLRGRPAGAHLAAADGDLWVSDPRGRRPDRTEDLRDGVELEFPRPSGSTRATLVVRASSTPLGARVLVAALALQGWELPGFYARLDHDAVARAAFERAREREALPTVRVWDGRAWRTAGFLRDLPGRVLRDVALPLDLSDVPGDRLRVRIDGPPGLWGLDRAVVTWPAEGAHQELRVPLKRAIGEGGETLTGLLARADGRRHVLRPHRDRVTLVFPAPPLPPGRARSVLVEATGYYRPLVPVEGPPQRAAFRRLVEEPGAVARLVLEQYRGTPEVTASRD